VSGSLTSSSGSVSGGAASSATLGGVCIDEPVDDQPDAGLDSGDEPDVVGAGGEEADT